MRTLFPYTTLFRSRAPNCIGCPGALQAGDYWTALVRKLNSMKKKIEVAPMRKMKIHIIFIAKQTARTRGGQIASVVGYGR